MPVAYTLTPELRVMLKAPIGMLIRGSFAETMKSLKDLIEKERPARILSVGDTVTRNLVENHVYVNIAVVDNRVMRRNATPFSFRMEKILRATNPQGTITEEAVEAIRRALKDDCSVKIIVNGEEDLLALVAVLYSPDNSFVIYGQPYEGIVVVKSTSEKRSEIAAILKTMEHSRKAK